MDLRDLEALVALAEELHFGRAAERLHISQPPLTKRIQKLEKGLGLELFERNRHGVAITSAGREVLARARQVVAGVEQIDRLSAGLRSGSVGTISIAAVGSAFYEALPVLLERSRAELPGITFRVQELETPELIDAVRFGDVDVGFARPPVGHGLEVQTVWIEELVVAVNDRDPLAEAEVVTVHQLARQKIVLFDRASGPGYWDRVSALFDRAGVPLEPISTTDHVTTILGLVAVGIGSSVVPASSRRLRFPGVRYIALDQAAPLPLAAISAPNVTHPLVRAFLATLPREALVL